MVSRPWQLEFILAQRGGRCWDGERPVLKVSADLVAHPAKFSQSFRFSALEGGRIVERVMNQDGSRKIGAAFLRVIANCENVIEGLALKLVNMFGAVAGNVDAQFAHDGDCFRTNVAWLCSGARDFEQIAGVVAEQAFGHLADRAEFPVQRMRTRFLSVIIVYQLEGAASASERARRRGSSRELGQRRSPEHRRGGCLQKYPRRHARE